MHHIIARLHRPVSRRMSAVQNTNADHSRQARARVSNGKRLQLFGDGRSAGARRFRDLLRSFKDEFGNTASNEQSIRRLAQVSVELELLEAKRAADEAIDPVAFVTLVNAQRRLLRDLERQSVSRKPAPQKRLQEHLAARYGGAAAVTP
jgi:hypothetical protein